MVHGTDMTFARKETTEICDVAYSVALFFSKRILCIAVTGEYNIFLFHLIAALQPEEFVL